MLYSSKCFIITARFLVTHYKRRGYSQFPGALCTQRGCISESPSVSAAMKQLINGVNRTTRSVCVFAEGRRDVPLYLNLLFKSKLFVQGLERASSAPYHRGRHPGLPATEYGQG